MSVLASEDSVRKSSSVHFRVWTDVFDSLEEEARIHRVSLNTLVNQLLSAHTRDDWVFEEVEFVRMPKDAYRVILNLIPDDKLIELGKSTATRVQNTMMVARSNAVTLDAALDDLRFISKCGWFSLHETKGNGKKTITLVHDFGPKYSIIMSADAMNLFALFGVHPKITTTDSSVMIEY